jgi:inositol-phosphate transport system substrate-binding protein
MADQSGDDHKGSPGITRRRLLMSAGAVGVAAACSTAGGPAASPAGSGAASVAPASGAGGKTVAMVAWTIGPDAPSYYRRDNLLAGAKNLNSELQKSGSKTLVSLNATFESGGSWGDYLQKFTLAAEAKTSPDIMLAGHENFAPWVGPGYVIPLDDLIKKHQDKGAIKDVIPGLWNAMKLKGKTYGVPQDTEARPMYYRKDLLKKLGWEQAKIDALPDMVKNGEWTWSDFVATAKEAISKGVVEPAHGWYHRQSQGNDFYGYYYLHGGEMQDQASGKLVLVKDAYEKYFQMHADAVINDKITPKEIRGMEGKIWHETFTSGKVLFANAGTWSWAEWQKTYKVPTDQLFATTGFMLIPAATKGGKPTTLSHPLAYMVTGNAKDPDLAFQVIADATTGELNAKHAITSGHLAIIKGEEKVADYAKDRFATAVGYMLDYTHFIPNHPKFGTYDKVLYDLLGAVEAGQMTPKKAVDTAVSELQGQLGDDLIVK